MIHCFRSVRRGYNPVKWRRQYLAFLAMVLLSCQGDLTSHSDDVSLKGAAELSSHLGAWEMVYFESVFDMDTTRIVADETPLALTLLTPTHFSYQWRNSANSGAGTYTYDGEIIHQEFSYVQDSNFVGAVLSFKMEVRNDSLFFSGPVKAVSAAGESIINDLPQMFEIRVKSNTQ